MKKVYIYNQNHMDIIWRRCFEEYFYEDGHVVRPYTDIEEALFDSWIEIVKNSKCKYSIEQTLTVKKYLERNPDKVELFKQLLQEERIEIMGGGETIIDANMPCGEGMVRNHLYSILWCDREFGVRPLVNTSCDIFGLSAQMPQIMRKLGYSVLSNYCRVFDNPKPYWRGLNGDVVLIEKFYNRPDIAEKMHLGDYFKYSHCPQCMGEGCIVCKYTGMDSSHKNNMPKIDGEGINDSNDVFVLEGQDIGSLEGSLEKVSKMDAQIIIVEMNTEEVLPSENFAQRVAMCVEKYNLEIEFVTNFELYYKFAKEYLDKLAAGDVPESEIDHRVEGNPVGTGCFVTRIKLKQHNREIEDLLLSCEKFATFAADLGMIYPKKKIEKLWNMMSILHFHDSITATHKDRCYEELLKHIRNIKLGAAQIYGEAMKVIASKASVPEKVGYKPVIVFNPLNWEVKDIPIEVVINFGKTEDIQMVELTDYEGNAIEVLGLSVVENEICKKAKVLFKCSAIPSIGYKVLYFRKEQSCKSEVLEQVDYIENEYYKIEVGENGIESIYDKELQRIIATQGANQLILEDDIGGPWETIKRPENFENLFAEGNPKIKIINRSNSSTIVWESGQGIAWKQEVTLYQGIHKIFFKTDVDWDIADKRLRVAFPLSFSTPNDEAFYEIPYGTLKREKYEGVFTTHMDANGDWPAIHFVTCQNNSEKYNVTLMNRGTGSYKLENRILYMSILRSPTAITGLDIYDGTDKGHHSFEYCLTSGNGNLKDAKVVQQGMEYNTWFQSVETACHEGILPETHSFLSTAGTNVIVTAIKRAEADNEKIIRMYEAYGEKISDELINFDYKKLMETNLLEENGREIHELAFNSFEIKTVKIY